MLHLSKYYRMLLRVGRLKTEADRRQSLVRRQLFEITLTHTAQNIAAILYRKQFLEIELIAFVICISHNSFAVYIKKYT